ncbi:cytochrome P450 [Mesorhizobium waimense]|uniref:Cytochrome P450 n=1 Tax=Mesorhizobium waimense TaxID=1300307 RepID=A0A3A5KE58_9HYPH|nr:cytochrome P450 [Mesorhizobium waimense]RJT32602.1 cytochrome P450 [Mesorhizobium waimense]
MNPKPDETTGLFDEQFRRDPHAYWSNLRAQSPVAWSERLDAWLVMSHSAALTALHDKRLTMDVYSAFRPSPIPVRSSFEMEPEENAQFRRAVAPHLRTIARDTRQVEAVALALARQIDDSRQWDLAADFAEPLAHRLVRHWLGLTPDSHLQLLHLLDKADQVEDPSYRAAAGEIATELLLTEIVTARNSGSQTLLARLARAWPEWGGKDADLAAFVSPMTFSLVKGIGTRLLVHSVAALCLQPALQRVVQDGGFNLAERVAEEASRWEPVQQAIPRRASNHMELEGRHVARGERLLIVLSAVCRDPAQHPEPHRFDPFRTEPSLAFGHGSHGCLGGGLATAATAVALVVLLRTVRGPLRPAQLPSDVPQVGLGLAYTSLWLQARTSA